MNSPVFGDFTAWAEVVATSPIATMLLAGDEQIWYANDSAQELLGTGHSSIFECIGTPDHPTVRELISAAAGSAQVRAVNGDRLTVHIRQMSSGPTIVQATRCDEWAAVDQVIAEQQRFRTALMELSELAHTTRDDDDFYQRLLEEAIAVVPGAQGGSVQLKIPDTTTFRFVAAVGYDLAGLQQQVLDQRHFFRDTWDPNARLIYDFENKGRTPEIREWLQTIGRLNEIVVNVSAPVLSEGYPIAFLSLDNFENPSAMTKTSIEMTTVLSGLIGDLWRRRELEDAVRREREAFRHLALHDPLTGVANRRNLKRSLTDTMAKARRSNRPSSVLFVDIDDFKGVNDRLGHEVGDSVLTGVANGLAEVVRAGDLVGRWGGDEFLILPYRLDTADQVMELAERVLKYFESEIDVGDGQMYRSRLTVGIGWSPDSRVDVDGLVRSADEALYEAKTAGKGIARFKMANETPVDT